MKPFVKKLIIGSSLLIMMISVIALSLTVFIHSSLRLDEAQSLFQTNRDVAGMLNLIAQDVHVPLYHTLLHYWQLIFGNDIVTARMMSLVFFVATVPAVYLLASYVFNRKVGLFAAFLVALSPFMQWYGSEARMYSMLAFLTVIHQLAFMKLFKEGKTVHWLWFTLTAVLGVYTHYFFILVLLAEVTFFIFARKQFAVKKAFRKFCISAAVVIGALLPWLYYVHNLGTASNTQPNLSEPTSIDLFNTYAQFIFGFQTDSLNTVIISLWPLIVLLAFFGLQKARKTTSQALFFAAASTIPVIGAFLISVTLRPFYQSRYLIVALPALLIFVAWVLSVYPKKLAIVLRIVLVAGIVGLLIVQIMNPATPVKEDYREAINYLNNSTTVQDVIVVAAPFTIYPTEYYYNGNAKVTTQPIWNRFERGSVPAFDETKLDAEVRQNTNSYQKAWVMLSFDQGYNEKIKQYYDTNFERLDAKEFSKNLWVYSYKLRYDKPLSL